MTKFPKDIEEMDLRIKAMKKKKEVKKSNSSLQVFVKYAFRMATEFVAPIIVALCIGYLADKFFNTKPIIMLAAAIFGCAAGVLNMYRTAQEIDKDMGKE